MSADLPILIAGLREIADRFDHVLLDQWGVLHEGRAVFPPARDCVLALRAAGKRVLVLSNSGKRAAENLRRIADHGLPADAYDGVVTSGEVAWHGLRQRAEPPFSGLGTRAFVITRGRDRSIIDGLSLTVVGDIEDAEFILQGGLDDAASEHKQWEAEFRKAAARGLPMLCANPDVKMFGAQGFLPGPGALAAFYESLGGTVAYIGKPHRAIFTAALHQLGDPDPSRVLMVGDSVLHDIAGGRGAGLLTALITSGVHKAALAHAHDRVAAIRGLTAAENEVPHWAMAHLAW
ncbi:MAG TPA: TIGR01459 family HAD-type hydrolase [Dongiaceae bacterium]|jgi:HAD superfamily hydrolase (TIGR01459 family)|nr:TIGR01459 family HAD-type hydrolase [Dongiaceae bacterium]